MAILTMEPSGRYQPDTSRIFRMSARARRDRLEEMLNELDRLFESAPEMDTGTAGRYNDLRGMVINLINAEGQNIRVY